MARPKLSSAERQTRYLPIRVKECEYKVIKTLAAAADKATSDYVRTLVFTTLGLMTAPVEAKVSPKK